MEKKLNGFPLSENRPALAAIFSLVIPGAGQLYLGRRWKGLVILLMTLILAFLVPWAFSNGGIGQVQAGETTFSWLWFPLILFWAWNIVDAWYQAQGRRLNSLPGDATRHPPFDPDLIAVGFGAEMIIAGSGWFPPLHPPYA